MPIETRRLLGIQTTGAFTANPILEASDKIKMLGVDAATVPTEMIDLAPINIEAHEFKHAPVGQRHTTQMSEAPIPMPVTVS